MTRRCEESEKWLERHLTRRVKETGGLCLKYSNPVVTGFPDRILLYPGGEVRWVELKSKGKEPTPLQLHRILQLRRLGFRVWVCDSRETVEEIVSSPTPTRRGR